MKYWRGQEAKINSECFGVGFVKQLMNSGLNSLSKRKRNCFIQELYTS